MSLKSDKNNGYFTWRSIYIFYNVTHFFLEWQIFQTKVVQKLKTHILCLITSCWKSCSLWCNVEKYYTTRQAIDDNIIWHIRVACWIPKARNTPSECVILIAILLQPWLHERASTLRYTYIACLVSLWCVILEEQGGTHKWTLSSYTYIIQSLVSFMYQKFRCLNKLVQKWSNQKSDTFTM